MHIAVEQVDQLLRKIGRFSAFHGQASPRNIQFPGRKIAGRDLKRSSRLCAHTPSVLPMTEVGAELPIRPRARMTQLAPFRPLPLDPGSGGTRWQAVIWKHTLSTFACERCCLFGLRTDWSGKTNSMVQSRATAGRNGDCSARLFRSRQARKRNRILCHTSGQRAGAP